MAGDLKPFLLGVGLMFVLAFVFVKNQAPPAPVQPFDEIAARDFLRESGRDTQHPTAAVKRPTKPHGNLRDVHMPRVCLHNNTSNEYYRCRREALLQGCSEICDTTIMGEPSMFFNFARKHVDCVGVWMNEEIDASATDGQWPPPEYPPEIFIDDFRQHGAVEVRKTGHYKNRYSGGDAMQSQWTKEQIDAMVAEARQGKLGGTYGTFDTNEVRKGLRQMDVRGKVVLVIGSELPWVEACALEAGASEVWTLEYGRIKSTHPQIKPVTPDVAREMYRQGTLPMFDAVLTYSSVEHSGLGRYGDALNPWGDMQAMARAWCVTKPGGDMLLGVMECGSNDAIEYNLHRCYHKNTYTHLTANWMQMYRGTPALQTTMTFKKAPAPDAPRVPLV
eukprot:m.223306 g.223306  ORF g.223306 m.223306 type:complete len:390 (-) comp16228_c0_seq1:161-1330(-)